MLYYIYNKPYLMLKGGDKRSLEILSGQAYQYY